MQRKYEDENEANFCTTTGLTSSITAGMEAKCQKLIRAFTKYLSIANPHNDDFFLSEVLFRNWFSPRVLAVIYFSFDHYESITGFEYSQMLEFP